MKITSLEIKEHEFDKAFRGYSISEVNGFLDDLGREWDKMLNETQLLKMRLEVAEKNAAKFQDMESTLFNTIKNAEENSRKKLETASNQAEQIISEAKASAEEIISKAEVEAQKMKFEAKNEAGNHIKEAENMAVQIVAEAEAKVKDIQTAAKAEIATLDASFHALEQKRDAILDQLKNYNKSITNLINNPEVSVPQTDIKITEIPQTVIETEAIEEVFAEKEVASISSAVNSLQLDNQEESDKTDLEIIEGIGPKIKEILNRAGILNFRTLAMTPEYKLREILSAAGPQFNAHDPGTWNEQALLAENGKWDELKTLQEKLIAGRPPVTEPVEKTVELKVETDGTNTDEMLDKVNKVKAAIRKAMAEKPVIEKTVVDKKKEEEPKTKSTSFFDGL